MLRLILRAYLVFYADPGTAIKKTLLASEVERADVREARLDWRYYRQPAMQKQPGRLEHHARKWHPVLRKNDAKSNN